MSDTHSSLYYLVGAPLMAAISLCSMPTAYSSFDGVIGTSFVTASILLYLGTMPNTNSAFLGIIGTSFMATTYTNSPTP